MRRAPRLQHREAERLGDKVVGPGLQPGEMVFLGVAGREHEDRHADPLAPHLADHVLAVDVGQAHVEDHEVGVAGACRLEGVAAGAGNGHLVIACG